MNTQTVDRQNVTEVRAVGDEVHVIAKTYTMPCGCRLSVGIRLGDQENVAGFESGEGHESIVQEVLRRWKAMPPSDDEVGELFERLHREVYNEPDGA